MEILLAVTDGAHESEVVVSVDSGASAGELAAALGGGPGRTLRVRRTAAVLEPDATLAEVDLVSGDEVEFVDASTAVKGGAAQSTPVLTIITGPRRGERLTVNSDISVGRDESADFMVPDALMSRVHARFSPGPSGALSITDLGSSNGTAVDGDRVSGTVDLRAGAVVTCGVTQFEVRLGSAGRTAAVRRAEGTIGFSRPPRVVPAPIETDVPMPSAPLAPEGRRIPFIATVAPIGMAAIMSVFAGPIMLVFAVISPLMMLANRWEDARGGRKLHDRDMETYAREASSAMERSLSVVDASARRRHEDQPDVRVLADRIATLHPSLWERRAEDPDALVLRVGTADQESGVRLTGGPADDDQREEAIAMRGHIDSLRIDRGAPFLVDLLESPVAGIVGNAAAVADTIRWMTLQAVAQCSPNDLAVCVVAPGSTEWGWARWLPHARTLRTDAAHGRTVAVTEQDGRGLLAAIDALVTERETVRSRKIGQESVSDLLPRVLLVVPDGRAVSEATLTALLARGTALGVSAIIGSVGVDDALGVTETIVDAVAHSVLSVRTGRTVHGVSVEGIDEKRAMRAARALSPVRDTTQRSAAGETPTSVLLRDLLGMVDPTVDDIINRWESSRGSARLDAPIGIGPAGPVSLDLRVHGPHGLVAGTTGSGKSELLQSLVVSLASQHSPRRLNFVLIDYKGGAAFKDCVDLPHTVGFFTDLDSHLAVRALVSLNAELKRREHILSAHGAKDIVEMEEMNPDAAPANLLIVFDEFAFLKRTVPEFVAGVVDIAQRGRSLGVHLILATQRPSGVIDENIRANTNLRIALRVADQADSEDVIDRPDAVGIPKSVPGRAFVRTGPSDVRPVQTAYANARRDMTGAASADITVLGFDEAMSPTRGVRGHASRPNAEGPTDLQRLVASIRGAAAEMRLPAQPVPWLEPLPAVVDAGSLPVTGDMQIALGVVDTPETQSQDPYLYDPARDGHLVVFGASGAGKSTLVRTYLARSAATLDSGRFAFYVLDFASRALSSLAEFPHCGGVINADEPERVERLFAHLDRTVADRKREFGGWGVSSVSEAVSAGHSVQCIAVAIDGFAAFHSTYQMVDHGDLIDRLLRLLSDGRSVGVFFVITGDRRNAIPSSVSSLMSSRLVMRMGEPDEYVSLGLSGDLGRTEVLPGRAFTVSRHDVQIAVLGTDPTGIAQGAEVRALAAGAVPSGGRVVRIEPLEDHVPLAELRTAGTEVALARHGDTGDTVTLDLLDSPVFVVAGPERSGRTTALRSLVSGISAKQGNTRLFLAAPRRTALADMDVWEQVGRGTDGVDSLLVELAAEVRERDAAATDTVVVVVDDGEEMMEGAGATALADIIRRARDTGVVVLAAVSTTAAHRSFGGWVSDIKRQRHAMVLCPDVDVDGDLFGVRFPRKASRRFPPGRGYLVRRGSVDYCHVGS